MLESRKLSSPKQPSWFYMKCTLILFTKLTKLLVTRQAFTGFILRWVFASQICAPIKQSNELFLKLCAGLSMKTEMFILQLMDFSLSLVHSFYVLNFSSSLFSWTRKTILEKAFPKVKLNKMPVKMHWKPCFLKKLPKNKVSQSLLNRFFEEAWWRELC